MSDINCPLFLFATNIGRRNTNKRKGKHTRYHHVGKTHKIAPSSEWKMLHIFLIPFSLLIRFVRCPFPDSFGMGTKKKKKKLKRHLQWWRVSPWNNTDMTCHWLRPKASTARFNQHPWHRVIPTYIWDGNKEKHLQWWRVMYWKIL